MIDEDLLKNFDRLSYCKTIEDSFELLKIYQESMFYILIEFQGKPVKTIIDRDANLLFQMMFSKTLYLEKNISGVSFDSSFGKSLNNLIDPTIVAISIRNIFETACVFHLIYSNTSNDDEKTILYSLWKHAGLKYRSRFKDVATTKENIAKMKGEKKEMERLENEIISTKLFNSLDEKNQGKILTKLKEKDYKITITDGKVKFLSWQDVTELMSLEKDLFDKLYTYFSLYTHPSNVSVFQFSEFFTKGEESFKKVTNFNLRNAFVFLSLFISDYIKYFPETLTLFEKLPLLNQIIIDFKQFIMRGEEFSINNSFEQLIKDP